MERTEILCRKSSIFLSTINRLFRDINFNILRLSEQRTSSGNFPTTNLFSGRSRQNSAKAGSWDSKMEKILLKNSSMQKSFPTSSVMGSELKSKSLSKKKREQNRQKNFLHQKSLNVNKLWQCLFPIWDKKLSQLRRKSKQNIPVFQSSKDQTTKKVEWFLKLPRGLEAQKVGWISGKLKGGRT